MSPGGAIFAETDTRVGKKRPKVTPCTSSTGNTFGHFVNVELPQSPNCFRPIKTMQEPKMWPGFGKI